MKYRFGDMIRQIMRKRIKGISILFVFFAFNYFNDPAPVDVYDVYVLNFSYITIPVVYAPVFLFNIYGKIKQSCNDLFITRFKCKKDIQIYNISEIMYESVCFAVIHNMIFLLVNINYILQACDFKLISFILINTVSQVILWTMYGSLFLCLSVVMENKIIVCVTVMFALGSLFLAKSFEHTFVYSKYVYDIYDAVIIMPETFSVNHVIRCFLWHIFIFGFLFYTAYRLYLNKNIYSEGYGEND